MSEEALPTATGPEIAGASASGTQAAGPQVGVDEWVARRAQRREYLPSWLGGAERASERVGWWPRLGLACLVGLLLPLFGLGGFQLQVGIDALVIALLAVGLNIVVGWAGLLDLGYVAFFGFGAYAFALLDSGKIGANGIHLPSLLSVPTVMIGAGILGLLVGLPSRRLSGDYLAIVTLFFGEAFVEFTNNVDPRTFGGANGIVGIDTIHVPGYQFSSNKGYYYLLVVLLVATMAVLRLLDSSRTGRAWRAIRDDPLAAASMTIPIDRVKLMAFAFGAMVAALAGTIFAAQQISVFPNDFDTPILILIYAGLILGGAGSIAGAATGALVVMVIYDGILRSPTDASYVFYGVILLTLIMKLRVGRSRASDTASVPTRPPGQPQPAAPARQAWHTVLAVLTPWRRLALVLAGTVAFGYVVYAIASAISHSWVAGAPQSTGLLGSALHGWVVVPANPQTAGNIGYVLLICLLIALIQVKGKLRYILLVPTLYLASFVWETVLAANPAITRQIMIGAILIVMMNARPQGLLGSRRVEVV